ncbi:MAG: adenylate/guanylate cyclase domain-containing protein [Betaproteobacteria bacterium]|nr:adenylate/guanylate cyclase domain-containing protein [Betaproteobacteria bacterium]
MASNKSAAETVKLLNDLFGRFDKWAKDFVLEEVAAPRCRAPELPHQALNMRTPAEAYPLAA